MPTKPKRAPAVRKPAPTAVKPVTAKPARAVSVKGTPKTAVKSSVQRAAPRKKPVPAVTIRAVYDAGWGNVLTIRGEGGGLCWDRGVPAVCVAPDTWELILPEAAVTSPVVFKCLFNDHVWSCGDNFTVGPGESALVRPVF